MVATGHRIWSRPLQVVKNDMFHYYRTDVIKPSCCISGHFYLYRTKSEEGFDRSGLDRTYCSSGGFFDPGEPQGVRPVASAPVYEATSLLSVSVASGRGGNDERET